MVSRSNACGQTLIPSSAAISFMRLPCASSRNTSRCRGVSSRSAASVDEGSRSAASVEVVALLRKPDAIKVQVPVKYVGFDIPNEFVVGYGLDFAERYRELPYVGILKPGVYARV